MGVFARLDRLFERLSNMQTASSKEAVGQGSYPLQEPLLMLGPNVPFTIGDSLEHVMIQGASGSGKSSAALPAFLRPMLRKGYGAIFCTVKETDRHDYIAWAQAAGREGDILHVRPGGPYRFNFLDYCFSREGSGAGLVENAVAVFMEVIEARASRKESDSCWTEGVRRLLRHSIETLRVAGLAVTMTAIKAIIDGMPLWNEATRKAEYPEDSFLEECLARADARGVNALHLHNYWIREMARKGSERSVSGTTSTLLNMADPYLSGPVAELFCSDEPSNFGPHLARTGALIVLDLPVSEWGDAGRKVLVSCLPLRHTEP